MPSTGRTRTQQVALSSIACVAVMACTPRTLIVRVPHSPHGSGGVTFSCDQLDPSSVDPAAPPVADTCSENVVTNADSDAGVPENHPNTRFVYPAQCATIQEFRILDPASDSPRITVTCAEVAAPAGLQLDAAQDPAPTGAASPEGN